MSGYPGFLKDKTKDPLCNPGNADLFVPDRVEQGRVHRAKLVCRGCPFRAPCLVWGMRNAMSGVYGGTELHDGREVRRGRRALL